MRTCPAKYDFMSDAQLMQVQKSVARDDDNADNSYIGWMDGNVRTITVLSLLAAGK